MMLYHLADCTQKDGETCIEARLELSEQEYAQIREWFHFSGFYHTCRSMMSMALESGADLENYLTDLKRNEEKRDAIEIDRLLITGNKLLISFLSFIKVFIDVLSKAISDRAPEKLPAFQKANGRLYDAVFGYRFFTRMRNYVVHYDMPLTSITDSAGEGVTVRCSRDALLLYDRWSSVKDEIAQLPEDIDIEPFIRETQSALYALYLKALEVIAEPVIEANHKFTELCKKNGVSSPILLIVDEDTKTPRLEVLPLHLMNEFIEDLKRHPHYDIHVTNSD